MLYDYFLCDDGLFTIYEQEHGLFVKKVASDKKEADIPVTVSCGKANARGTKTNMVCKIV